MMRIGIITFHDTTNFGSYLQTYGLYKKLEDLGCECEVINYQCESLVKREIPERFKFTWNLRKVVKEIWLNTAIRKKYKFLFGFLLKNMTLSERVTQQNIKSLNNRYDKFFVGSDIVWGLDITNRDTTYFLDFVEDNNKKYAFSSSIGNSWSEDEQYLVKPYLERFNKIAVREEEAADWVENLIKKRPEVVCDPTMLLTSNEWLSFASMKYCTHKYVLVYFSTEECIKAAKEYAKHHNLPIYLINYSLPISGVKNIKPLTIDDFLSLFKSASFIFTASYHGMLFSIYFNREFSYFNRSHKSRMQTLANILGVQDREGTKYDVMKMAGIEWTKVNTFVEDYRNKSMACLKAFLQK